MPPGFSEREREGIRASLIQAALESMAKGGYAKTSVDELCRDVRIAKGSFYLFFPSKEELFLAAFESLENGFRTSFSRLLLEGPGSPPERIRAAFSMILDLAEGQPAIAAIDSGLVARLARKLPPERVAAHQAQDRKELEEAYGAWLRSGTIRDVGAPAFMGLVYSLFYLSTHRHDMDQEQWRGAKALLVDSLAGSLAPGRK